jgi:WD40 repeat protein
MPAVFLSYAREDGSELAQRLQHDLAAAGFDAWLDMQQVGGGARWTVEIEGAIDRAQVVLALLTPGSYASGMCRAEQLRSLRKGKCVIPVFTGYGAEVVPIHFEGRNWRKYPEQWRDLLGDIERLNGAVLPEGYRDTRVSYITTPPTVANYIDRPEAFRSLRDRLLGADGHRAIALTALEGMGGIGKTVLAQALFQDEVVRQAFPDGLVWITVGREPTRDWTARLREITRVLSGTSDESVAPETSYRTTLAGKAALIVIDDIWNKSDLDPFLADSPRSRFLFTTRDASIARFSGAREHRLDLLSEPQAGELLALWAGLEAGQLPPAADDILRECDRLPLALSTMGALLRGAASAEWADTAGLLRNADLAAIEEQLPPGQQSFFRAIDVSVSALPPEMQQRYRSLAVLLDNMPAPLPILQTLWRVGEAEARRIGRRLADRSLAQRDGEGGIRLHDLQLDYVCARYGRPEALELIHGAVRLSAHVIEKDPRQFASQVAGRLLPHWEVPEIRRFAGEITAGAPKPWLRPLHPALHPPGTALLRTLEGHSEPVTSVAVTPDSKWVVSASWDHTLKVWDLVIGRALRTLEGHSADVSGVVVTPDGQHAVSASGDKTLKVWDLATGRELRTLEGHSKSVLGVAVTPDGRRAVSASADKTLKIWDLETGCALRTLKGHSQYVSGVAVTPDGRRAVSASYDNTLKLWDLADGHELRTLEGHSNSVLGIAVTPDGRRAVSAAGDNTLRVWDLDTGRALRTLEGHSDVVSGVAVTPDGRHVISVSVDLTLKVWDIETGRTLHKLEGHSGYVYGVAVTPDGKRVVSVSADKTLKVWDRDASQAVRAPESHSAAVWGVAVTPDGKRAVSASRDNTVKVWDLETGHVLRTLEGHASDVWSVAVTWDGRCAVSASGDRTLKVWDLETCGALRTLEGHSADVLAAAVTPDGKRAVSGSWDRTLRVWDLESGCTLHTLEGQSAEASGIAVTPDGKCVVSAFLDHTMKVWDLESGRALCTLEGHTAEVYGVAVRPDGKVVVSASGDRTLKVWDLGIGLALRTLEGHSGSVSGVAVTPDGKRAASASWDKTLKVWDLETGLPVSTFHCDGPALCCAFAGNHHVVAGDAGGRVYFLSLEGSRGPCDVIT